MDNEAIRKYNEIIDSKNEQAKLYKRSGTEKDKTKNKIEYESPKVN